MLVYRLRHGETEWTKETRVMGRTPVPLSERGRAQVALLASALAGEGIVAVYTSTVARARESAAILAAEWKAPIFEEARLDESPFERWVGKTYDDLRGDRDFALYHSTPTRASFSLHEGIADIQRRAVAAVEWIAGEAKDGKAALVSHRDVIKPIIARHLGIDLDSMHRLSISTASATLLDLGADPPRFRFINLAPWRWAERMGRPR